MAKVKHIFTWKLKNAKGEEFTIEGSEAELDAQLAAREKDGTLASDWLLGASCTFVRAEVLAPTDV